MNSKRRRRRGAWRWIFSGADCIGQIEQDDTGHWRVYVGRQFLGTVASEEVAAQLVHAAAAGERERTGKERT